MTTTDAINKIITKQKPAKQQLKEQQTNTERERERASGREITRERVAKRAATAAQALATFSKFEFRYESRLKKHVLAAC